MFSSHGEDLIYHFSIFIVNAIPSCQGGHTHQTHDMAELFIYICGSRVEDQEQVIGLNTALQCGYEGCETSWVTN